MRPSYYLLAGGVLAYRKVTSGPEKPNRRSAPRACGAGPNWLWHRKTIKDDVKRTFDLRHGWRRTVHYRTMLRAPIVADTYPAYRSSLAPQRHQRFAAASGHGPVFGGAPPTLGKGGMATRSGLDGTPREEDASDDEQMLRTMLSLGITEDLQISASLPITLDSGIYMPRGRVDGDDVLEPGFRNHHGLAFSTQCRRRWLRASNSTLFVGATVPMQEFRSDGMLATPSVHASVASGFASRSHYFWVGGGYQDHTEREGDQMGVIVRSTAPLMATGRPSCAPTTRSQTFVSSSKLSASTPHGGLHHGFEMVVSGGDSILVGPTALLLYKQYGLEAGLLFPVYQQTNFQPEEKLRFGVNFTYFFWRK